MGGTKFMVIRFKELIKTAVFAILGAVIIIALIYFFLPHDSGEQVYKSGTYTSEVTLGNETVLVETTVDSDSIKSVRVIEQSETVPVFYPLLQATAEQLEDKIIESQSAEVQIPEGAEVTASVILEAVKQSLNDARQGI